MIAPTKRRQLLYFLSLPFVVGFVVLVVMQLAALKRAEVVANLTHQVAHQETPHATAALRQLAAMPRPPVDVLVSAATSADSEMAREAQLLISGVLRRWQRRIESDHGTRGVARQLKELAASLNQFQASFSPGDHRWLSTTTRKVLRLANRIPPPDAPLVAAHCDAVLATIAAREASMAALVNRDLAAARPPIVTSAVAPVELLADRPTKDSALPRGAAPNVDGPFAGAEQSTTSSAAGRRNPPIAGPREEPSYSPQWEYPGLNTQPAIPIDAWPQPHENEPQGAPSARLVMNPGSQLSMRRLADVEPRELLLRWLEAGGADIDPLEAELTERGFVRLSARLVAPLFSTDAKDRLRLVDDVLTEPGIDARPWLILLAEDADADVRLLAVTIMATSDDPELIEKAWQVAIHDRDPRIAGLANRLRERRDSTQRR